MRIQISYIAEENRLDLTFSGNLDVSVAQDVLDLCKRVPPDLAACIIDLSNVVRLFDSGVALLRILYTHLTELGATIVVLADRAEVRELIPSITRPSSLRLGSWSDDAGDAGGPVESSPARSQRPSPLMQS